MARSVDWAVEQPTSNMTTTTPTYQLKRGRKLPWIMDESTYPRPDPATPSEWFCRRYPVETKRWGCPLIEEVGVDLCTSLPTTKAVQMNDNFFAAILSDQQLGHSVVFVEAEQQWYFLDPRDGVYHPTSEAKLMTLLSCLLVRCAEAMPPLVDKRSLFVDLRDDEVLKGVIRKARSVLAADERFFSAESPNRRVNGIETHAQMAKRFVQASVKPQPGRLLSMNECFERFSEYCHNHDVEPVQRRQFKQLIVETVREEFGLGLRNDLKNAEGNYLRGWKGLAVETAQRN